MDDGKPKASAVLSVAAALALLYVFRTVLWPLALALVLMILIRVVSRRIKRALPSAGERTVSTVTAVTIGGLVLGAMLFVVNGVSQNLAEAETIYRRLDQMVGEVRVPGLGWLSLEGLAHRMDAGETLRAIASNVQGAGAGLTLTALYLVFIVATGRSLEQRVTKIIAARRSSALVNVLTRSVQGVEVYTYIQTITGLMMAIAAFFLMIAFGLKSALFWALTLFLFS